jgi:HEAT repeat protein
MMNPDSLEQIENNLRSAALNQRKAALDQLADYPSELAIPILQRLAQESDFGLRRLAVMGFGNHKTTASFQVLQKIITNDQDANVQAEAANSIFEFGDMAVTPLVELFHKSTNWLVRQTVISLLVDTEYYEALFAIAKNALQDETQTVKEVGILAMGQLLKSPLQEQALEILAELAESPDWRTRWRSAIALQYSSAPQAKNLITKLQQDDHYRVVAAALEVAATWQN